MSLDAEAKYVRSLITYSIAFNGRQLVWRGYKFQQWRPGHDPENWETVIAFKRSHRVINWGPDRLSDLEWVRTCLYAITETPGWLHDPVDGVPAEIHAIADFDAYMSALIAYKAAILL